MNRLHLLRNASVSILGSMLALNLARAETPLSIKDSFAPVPGLNLAEKQTRWLWSLLPEAVKACWAQPTCQLSPEEREVAGRILKNLDGYSERTLVFESEKSNPGRFSSATHEVHRVAVTGDDPTGTIYINSDRAPSLAMNEILAILAHEVVHHVGVEDDSRRLPDSIGAKIGRYFLQNSVRADLAEYGHPEIQSVHFGVSLPETTDYFKVFPVPTVRVESRMFLADAGSAYDVSLDPGLSSECYSEPGAVFVNQQVSDASTAIERVFAGDKFVGLTFKVQARNVCLIVAHAPNADMRGVHMTGSASMMLRLLNPQEKDWRLSALSIQPESLRALLRPRAPEESLEAGHLARVESVDAPATVPPGGVWKVQAHVKYADAASVDGCTAGLRGTTWHSVDLVGIVPPLMFDRCEIERLGSDQLIVRLEKDVSARAVPGTYSLDAIGLTIKPGRMISALLSKSAAVQIVSPQSPFRVDLVSVKLLGADSGRARANETYDLEFRLRGADSIHDGFISAQGVLANNARHNFVGNLTAEGNAFFHGANFRNEGDLLVATYKFRALDQLYGHTLERLAIYTFQFTTSNFGEVFVDFRLSPFVVTIVRE